MGGTKKEDKYLSKIREWGGGGGRRKGTHSIPSTAIVIARNAVQLFYLRKKSSDIQLGKVANRIAQRAHRTGKPAAKKKISRYFLAFALTISTNVKYAIRILIPYTSYIGLIISVTVRKYTAGMSLCLCRSVIVCSEGSDFNYCRTLVKAIENV